MRGGISMGLSSFYHTTTTTNTTSTTTYTPTLFSAVLDLITNLFQKVFKIKLG